jgi:hypothetical protein
MLFGRASSEPSPLYFGGKIPGQSCLTSGPSASAEDCNTPPEILGIACSGMEFRY